MLHIKISEELHKLILNSSFYQSFNYVENNFSRLYKRKLSATESTSGENNRFKVLKKNGNVELKLKWYYDLKGCINTSPMVIKYKNQYLVLCVSFYQVFAVINFDTGQMMSEMIFPEPVQGGICVGDFGKAYVGCLNGSMYCVDITNCQKIWSFRTNGIIKSRPCFCLGRKAIVFGSYDGYAYCISTDGGNLIWKHNVGFSISVNPVYNVKLKTVYLASSNKICFCLSESDGKMLWKYSVNSPVMGSPCSFEKLGHDDCILWPEVEGVVHCTKCTTGDLVWTYKAQNQIYSSITTFENYFLFGCKDKNVYSVLVADDNKSCSLSFKICLNCEISSTPCIFKYEENTYIFAVTNGGVVFLIDFFEQKVLQEIKMNDEIFCSPIMYDNRILFGCNDNNLYCFSIGNG
ncbi:beta-alanine-activating enzyme [Agrilus planipennis]|uniref:Beta-alanine-activating enzyme n=1 Tax=Agrilus planipennis TaxID=224129 RepID=A0A7F5RCS0_AGRPL|nr:beta-alanine-activating enzyme [Agrilus planipennis]